MLSNDLKQNHLTEICCLNTDAGEMTLTSFLVFLFFRSQVLSYRHFLVCSMRQCMSEVWLGATGI